jgi:hypothetical protein
MLSIAALHDELTVDVKQLGYAADIALGSDSGVAARINATYPAVGVVFRPAMRAADILACVVAAEAGALDLLHVTWLAVLLSPGTIDATLPAIRALFSTLFAAAPQTLAALTAAVKVTSPTRAEELFGAGVVVTALDVAHALRGGA